MKKKYFFIILATAALFAFRFTDTPVEKLPTNIVVNGKLFTSLYQQQSAEYKFTSK